jgi:putative transposase
MTRTRYKIYETEYPYFITCSIVEEHPLFSIPMAAETILNALAFLQNQRDTTIYSYVIMENHIHMIAQSDELSKHLRSFKSWTARSILDRFALNGHTRQLIKLKKAKKKSQKDVILQVWKEGFHPKQIMGDSMMIQKIEYIHNNPVKRGYVDKPEHWRYSSARNYLGLKGLVPVTLFG